MQELRQSTVVKIRMGSAMDSSDGVTPETGLTLAAADQAELLKHNGAATVDISSSTFTAVTGSDGWYDLTLTTTDTNTLGQATVVIQDSSLMAPIFKDLMIVTANYWDAKYGTDSLEVDMIQLRGDTQSVVDFKSFVDNCYDASIFRIKEVSTLTGHTPQTGDNYTRIGALGAGLTALAPASTALSDIEWTNTRAGYLDNISSGAVALEADADPELMLDTTIDTVTSQTEFRLVTGAIVDDAYNNQAVMIIAASSPTTKFVRRCVTYDAISHNLIVDEAPGFTVIPGDIIKIFMMRGTDAAGLATDLATVDTNVDTVLTNLNAQNDLAAGQVTDACISSLNTYDGITRAEATADKNEVLTDHTLMKQTTAGTYERDTDSLQAIRDRGDAAWSTTATNPNLLLDTTISSVVTQTNIILAAGSDISEAYEDQSIVLYDASNSDYPSVRKVSSYDGSTKAIVLDSAPNFTMVAVDGVKVFVTAPGTTAPTVGQIADGVLDELTADHTGAGSLSLAVSSTQIKTDNLPTDPADQSQLEAAITTSEGNIRGTDSDTLKTISDQMDTAAEAANPEMLCDGVISSITSQSEFVISNGSAHDDVYNDLTIVITKSTDVKNVSLRRCTNYIGSSGTITIDSTPDFTIEVSDLVQIFANVVSDVAGTAATLHTTTDAAITALNDITVADIIAGISDGTYDFQEMQRLMFSMLLGKASGGGTGTLVFRDGADSKDRVTLTVDADGNRATVIRDGS